MTKTERERFEKEVLRDETLAAKVESARKTFSLVSSLASPPLRQGFKNSLAQSVREEVNKKSRPLLRPALAFSTALTLLVILFISWNTLFPGKIDQLESWLAENIATEADSALEYVTWEDLDTENLEYLEEEVSSLLANGNDSSISLSRETGSIYGWDYYYSEDAIPDDLINGYADKGEL
jgi:hypothetical protein